jgi:hypothetical protein
MGLDLIENSELGALAPSRLGNSFIGDEDYSNFLFGNSQPIVQMQSIMFGEFATTEATFDNQLRSAYSSKIDDAVNNNKDNDVVYLNNLLVQLRKETPLDQLCIFGCPPEDINKKNKRASYKRFVNSLSPKVDTAINNAKNWWINDINGKDCDYVIQRTKILADAIGNIAKMETDAGENSDGRVSKSYKEVFDNNYTPAIKNLKCEEKFKAKEDASGDIQRIKAEREKAKADDEAKVKALAQTNTKTNTQTQNTTIASSNKNKIIIGVGVGIAILTTILILKK